MKTITKNIFGGLVLVLALQTASTIQAADTWKRRTTKRVAGTGLLATGIAALWGTGVVSWEDGGLKWNGFFGDRTGFAFQEEDATPPPTGFAPTGAQESMVNVIIPENRDLAAESELTASKRGETHVSALSFGIQTPNFRSSMEDADIFAVFGPWRYFGVFDGHAGRNVAKWAIGVNEVSEKAIINAPTRSLHNFLFNALGDGLSVPDAAIRAVLEFDEQIAQARIKGMYARRREVWGPAVSGSTAIIFLLNTKTGKGYLVNLGDARGVVATGDPDQVALATHDHKPFEERERISLAGGSVVDRDGVCRVDGILAVSRALGDLSFKPLHEESGQRRDRVGQRPDVYEFNILPQDKFIILACDGVWDVMNNDRAIKIVSAALAERPGDGGYAAMKLVEAAYSTPYTDSHSQSWPGSTDNITAMVIPLDAAGSVHSAREEMVHPGYEELI